MLQNMALASILTSSSVRVREVAFRSVPLRATYYSAKNRSLRHSVLIARPFPYEAFAYVDTTVYQLSHKHNITEHTTI